MAQIDNRKAQYNDILYFQGNIFDEEWTVTKSDGTPYNMQGKSIVMNVKENHESGDIAETLSTEEGTITISGDDYNIIRFDKALDLDYKKYIYDVTNETDNYTISYGYLKVIKKIS